MPIKRFLLLYWVLICVGIVQVAVYYPKLPEQVASHFDGAGRPDAWMDKGAACGFHLGMVVGMGLFFLMLRLLIVYMLPRTPTSLVNMPNKDYWLAPERREETNARLAAMSGGLFTWLGLGTGVLLIAVFQLVVTANLREDQQLRDAAWVIAGCIGLLIVYSLVWTVRFYLKFKRVPEEAQ